MDDLIEIKFSLEGAPANAVKNIIYKNIAVGISYYMQKGDQRHDPFLDD